jgi:hypothetical protein
LKWFDFKKKIISGAPICDLYERDPVRDALDRVWQSRANEEERLGKRNNANKMKLQKIR